MLSVSQVLVAEVYAFFVLFFGIVAFLILTRRISTKNLLYGRDKSGTLSFSPGRIQMLVFTLGVALHYLEKALATGQLPVISPQVVALLGGSHAVYLGGKGYSMMFQDTKSKSAPRRARS